jgi:carboxylesterase type B
MSGTLTEETLFLIYSAWKQAIPSKLYNEIILAFFRTKALKVLERYPLSGTGDQKTLLSQIATQWVFACTNRLFARKGGSYSYVFGFPFDFDGWGSWTFCNGHVFHGGELPYLFQSAWGNFTDVRRRVSLSMATYWTNFAKSQDPNEQMNHYV